MQDETKKKGTTGASAPATTQSDNGNATPSSTPSSTGVSEPDNQNYHTWKDGGTGYAGQMEQAGVESEKRQNDPTYGQAYTNEGLQNAINAANQNGANITGSIYNYSQYDTPRVEAPGSSGMDEAHLSDASYAYVQYCKAMYDAAATPEEKAYWHEEAEKIRARVGYSGGADGSMYISNGEMDVAGRRGQYAPGNNYYTSGNGSNGSGSTASGMQGHLDAWQQAATDQSNAQVDYAVQQAVAELERALADAQIQYKEQAESVDRNARQAMDNSALYAEMRGDKGGIGQEQYNAIQNTQAQNHLAVQQAQTKLATDTQRQIADLRAQGEFQKADAALEITQSYLQQLISLEQWAAEYNLSVEQFNASLKQWQAEYDLAMQQLEISQNQWQQQFDASQNQWQAEYDLALQQMQISQDQWQKEFDRQSQSSRNTVKIGDSPAFDDVVSAAKKKGSADLANKYLGQMVESGDISLSEADYIFRVICGYSYDSLYENKYIITGKPDLNTGAPATQVAVVN